MPQIPVWEKQVGVERAIAPEIPQGWFTDEYRAMAQAGEAIGGLADLMQKLKEQDDRTKLRHSNVQLSTGTNAFQYKNDSWVANHYGDGFVYQEDAQGNLLRNAKGLAIPTAFKKKPLNQIATDWAADYDRLRDKIVSDNLSGVSQILRQEWLDNSELHKNQESLQINQRQIAIAQNAAEAGVWAELGTIEDNLQTGKFDLESARIYTDMVVQDAYAVGDLQKTAVNERMVQNFLGGLESTDKRLQTERDQKADEDYVQSLILAVDSEELTEKEAIQEINRNTRFEGDSQRINAAIARFNVEIGIKNENKRLRAEEIESTLMDYLRKRDVKGGLDFINRLPQKELVLFPVDERLSQFNSLAAAMAKPVPIDTNESVRSWLNNFAIDVKLGRRGKWEFDIAMREAFYGLDVLKDGKTVHVYKAGSLESTVPLIDDSAFTTIDERATTDLASSQLTLLADAEKYLLNMFLTTSGGVDINAYNAFIQTASAEQRQNALDMRNLAYFYQNDFSREGMKLLRENADMTVDRLGPMVDEMAGRYITAFNSKIASGDLSIPGTVSLPPTQAEIDAAWLQELQKRWPNLPQPKTAEEYNRLPSGTEYIHTDGTKRRKK